MMELPFVISIGTIAYVGHIAIPASEVTDVGWWVRPRSL
jgi:hypothetical protein